MAPRYKRPAYVEDAQVFVGAKIHVHWEENAELSFPAGWYDATVSQVHRISDEGPDKLFFGIKYDDDQEDLEWDEVFNGAVMDDKTEIKGEWSAEAAALLESLRITSPKQRVSLHGMPVSDLQKQTGSGLDQNSAGSRQGPAETSRHSTESHSRHQTNGFAAASHKHLHTNGLSHGSTSHPQSPDSPDTSQFGGGPGPSQAIPPNKRRRTDAGTAPGHTAQARQHHGGSAAMMEARFHGKNTEPGPGIGTAGQIKKVKLINFMCHDHLEIDFTPHVNFISGSNGSGKSAALQALQCCLGVKARDTGRATRAEQFIKTGTSHAVAAVSLWNTGEVEAFNSSVYGDTITIERTIRKSSSTFIIKDAMGRKVSEGKAHVDEIVESFNINAGNPSVCMTQDTARSFAGEHNDKAKYELYMEATHFAETIENLVLAKSHVSQMTALLDSQEKQILEKKEALAKITEKVDNMQQVEHWQMLQETYSKVIAWEQFYKLSDLVQQQQVKVDAMPERISAVTRALEGAFATLNQIEQEFQDQRQALALFQPRIEQLQHQQKDQQTASRTAARAVHAAQQALQNHQNDMSDLQAEKTALQQAAEEMQQQLATNSQAAVERHKASVKTQERATEAASAQASAARQAVREADAAVNQAAQIRFRADGAARDCNTRVQDLIGDLNRLQQSQTNPVTAFAPNQCSARVFSDFLGRLGQASSAGRFQRQPIGPIGSHLTLTDDKWAAAVEVAIGRALNTFIVHNFADQKTLMQIARQAGVHNLSVYICNYDWPLPDMGSGRIPQPPAHLTTVLQVLTIPAENGHVIQHALIIQHSIERLVLVQDRQQALQLIRAQTGRQGPAGAVINRCFTPDGGQAYGRKSTETWIYGDSRRTQCRLTRNVAGQIAEVQATLQVAQTAAGAAAREKENALSEEREAKRMREVAIRGKQQAERAKDAADSQLDELNSQQPDDASTVNSSLQDQLAEIADKDRQMRDLQRQVEEGTAALQTAQDAEAETKAAAEGLQQQRQVLLDENQACQDAIGDVHERKRDAEQNLQYLTGKLQQRKDAQNTGEQQLQQFRQRLASTKHDAEQVCQQTEEPEAREYLCTIWAADNWSQAKIQQHLQVEALVQKLTHATARIAQMEKEAGADLATLKVLQQQHQNQVSKLEIKFSKVLNAGQLLQDGVSLRTETGKLIRAKTEESVNLYFSMYMQRRGFVGRIKLNYNQNEMELKVRLGADKNKKNEVKDMKSLSGGERSFTTLCFMLALANVIWSPFHCMDEFDVFMDAINRRISLVTLLEFAIQNSHIQLILLSPQDVAAVEEARMAVLNSKAANIPQQFMKIVQMQHTRRGANR